MSNDSFSNFDICENSTGILLLENAVCAPDVLDLKVKFDHENSDSEDSEPDVIVLGVKRPTYEVITLEEDEEETIEQQLFKSTVQEALYSCPQCGKSFRVESLLRFHIRMHSEGPSLPNIIPPPDTSLLEYNSNCEGINHTERELSNDHNDERFSEEEQITAPENEENRSAPRDKKVKTHKHKSKTKKQKSQKCNKHKSGK